MIENLLWTGQLNPDQALALWGFIRQGDTFDERVSWWVEPILFGTECVLMISHTPSGREPLRIPSGGWVHFDGARFGPGRRKGGKDA